MKFYLTMEKKNKVCQVLHSVSHDRGFSQDEEYQISEVNRQKISFSVLSNKKYIRNTIVLCVAFFCNLYVFYGVSTWLPGLMMERGHAVLSGVAFLAVFLAGNISVAVLAGRLADTIGAKKVMGFFYICLVVMIVLLSMEVEGLLVYVFVFLVGGSVGVAQNMTVAITPQFFPIAFRGTIVGLCSASSRVGSAIAPIVVGILMQQQMGVNGIFLTFTIPAVIGMVAILQTRSCNESLQSVGSKSQE